MAGETEDKPSGLTVDTLHLLLDSKVQSVERQLSDMRSMLDERYATQTKAVDAAFLAQQTAMQTALTAAERAVQTALLAAEKAVNKAEVAADKRFEATNEFRGQLADQANTFITRSEADAIQQRNQERINDLTDRLNRSEGSATGIAVSRTAQAAMVGLAIAVITVVVVLANFWSAR